MSRRSRERMEVWQAKHYQPMPDFDWPLPPVKEFDFGDDDGNPVFDQRRHDPADGLQTAVKTNQGT